MTSPHENLPKIVKKYPHAWTMGPKNEIFNKQNIVFLSQGSLNQKCRLLDQKVCSVASIQKGTKTDKKVNTEDTLSAFRIFSSRIIHYVWVCICINTFQKRILTPLL